VANKLALGFTILFNADGASSTVMLNVTTGPIGFTVPGTGAVLNDSLAAAATGMINLNGDSSTGAITLTSLVLGVATLTCANVPSAGLHEITGQIVF
jgi:hypothetical protein